MRKYRSKFLTALAKRVMYNRKSIFASTSCYSVDVSLSSSKHPNKMPFVGTLVLLDTASDQAPHGANGHSIMIRSETVTDDKLRDLVGMGLNYYPDLDRHNVRHKVGVITKSWIEAGAIKVKGIVWKKDFPETEKDLKGRKLGMSMELAKVRVRDKDADVWELEDFRFTGATALWPKKAAYHDTNLAASAAGERRFSQMGDKTKKKTPAADAGGSISASAIGKSIRHALKDVMAPVAEGMKQFGKHIKGLTQTVQTMAASAASRETDGELSEILAQAGLSVEDVKAAKKAKRIKAKFAKKSKEESSDGDGSESDSEESVDANASISGSVSVDAQGSSEADVVASASGSQSTEPIAAAASDSASQSEEPKHRRVSASSHRRYNLGNLKASGRLSKKTIAVLNAAAEEIDTLRAADEKKTKAIKRLSGKLEVIQAQNVKFADQLDRKTLPGDASALLAKAGYDVSEMMSSGQVISTEQVDEIIHASGLQMSPVDSMRLKNVLYEKGLMGRGDITRFMN